MPEHLGDRQVGLGDRDVAPHLQGQLVRGQRPVGEHPQQLARRGGRACAAARRSAPTWSVTGSPWPAARARAGSSRVAAHRGDVVEQGVRAAARREPAAPSSGRLISGLEEMWASRWSPAISIRALGVQKTVSEGLWPGRCRTCRRRSRELELVAVAQRPGDLGRWSRRRETRRRPSRAPSPGRRARRGGA